MKKACFLLSFLFVMSTVFAQELRRAGPAGFPIYECEINGSGLVKTKPISGPPMAKFFVLGDLQGESDFVIIRFLNWYSEDGDSIKVTNNVRYESFNVKTDHYEGITAKSNKRASPKFDAVQRYFAVRNSDITKLSIPYSVIGVPEFSMGFITMPIKMRLKNFDFTDQFSLGATAGVKWRFSSRSPNYLNALIGINLGFVSIDSTNSNPSNPAVKESYPARNIGVLSPAVGLVAAFDKAQIGIFLGVDYLGKSNRDKYNWDYNKKPWLSFGIGINLFNPDKSDTPRPSAEQDKPAQ